MSNDPAFNALIDTLLNSPDGTARQKAAMTLGDYVDELTDEEYLEARDALNRALADNDPDVIGAVMSSLSQYNRSVASGGDIQEDELQGDAEDDILPQKGASCEVCGRPEPLIPEGGCERDDCPYG
jgi:hypothetical protein